MNGAPLTARLIRAGNLPAEEKRLNDASRVRIGRVLYDLGYALAGWQKPPQRPTDASGRERA